MESTAAAVNKVAATATQFDWGQFFANPVVIALVSSGIVGTILIFALKFIFRMGETNQTFRDAINDVGKLKSGVVSIERCVLEIQTILTQKYKLAFQQSISKYGEAHSPIKLAPQYRSFITESDVDEQVEKENAELLKWLKSQDPKTGLDAQDDIAKLVISGEVSKYLDLTKYKQNLYTKGKTSEDAEAILGIYLFEVLIPQLQLPDGDEPEGKKKAA